jgi:predicted DCC family thiol-disulfide oxidoreductase YuxK
LNQNDNKMNFRNIDYNNVVLFDGVCNLCNGTVNFLLKIDKNKKLSFSHLQSDFSKEILQINNMPQNSLDTVVFISNDKLYTKSKAVFNIFKIMPLPWKVFSYLLFIPEFISDYFYKIIANNRYSVFGIRDECLIPTQDINERFIN